MINDAADLADLVRLDRSLLHCFVVGPGVGEAIAVALPGEGWLFVDCCRVAGQIPTEELYVRYRSSGADIAVASVLTHPHEDHAEGFGELIEAVRPRFVAVPGNDMPREHLLFAATAGQQSADPLSSHEQSVARSVRAELDAIGEWERSGRGKVHGFRDGVSHDFGRVRMDVRAPDGELMKKFFRPKLLGRRFRREANLLSVVLELTFGRTTVTLGSDLPRYRTGGKQVATTGWDLVMKAHPGLGAHTALKVPHHGSHEASHPNLMTARAASRAWFVTPYNSSKLPRVADQEGLPALLAMEPSILLTGVPASKRVQAPVAAPGKVSLASLVSRTSQQPTGLAFLDQGVEVRPGHATGVLDCVWCVAFDDQGAVRGRWRGRGALEVVA